MWNKKVFMRKLRGFTLIEMNLLVIIVGVVAVVLVSFSSVLSKSFSGVRAKNKAHNLAVAAMEDIKCRKWDQLASPARTAEGLLGPDGSEATIPLDKRIFDDIDDFKGYSETPPRYQDGTVIPGLSGFSMTVDTVCYVDANLNVVTATTTVRKKIIVTVRKTVGVAEVTKVTLTTIVSQKDGL